MLSSSSLSNIKFKAHRTIVLPVVSFGCETWSFTLREELRSGVFDNMVLRGIFEPKWDEVLVPVVAQSKA
jgi:hypothetical protein